MRSTSIFAAVFVALLALPALAQSTPARIRGTIDKLDGQVLSVKQRDGQITTVTLAPGAAIEILVKRSLADIKPGDFVASTGIKGKDGKIHAIEVRIFPKATPDGGRQFAWDLSPDSVMTNATVGTVTKVPEGEVLHVTFKGGESELRLPRFSGRLVGLRVRSWSWWSASRLRRLSASGIPDPNAVAPGYTNPRCS